MSQPPTPDEAPVPVVGVGASAGGFEAFSQLLESLPDDTGMAFVLVQHLNPEHESRLTELLADRNLMPITEIEDGEEVRPDHVYVIPPNKKVQLADGHLRLTARDEDAGSDHHQHTIDRLFESLADELGPRAVGVLLSGTLTDGVLGLKEIRTREGTTMVQDPESANFPDLPQAAINAGAADFVLPPASLGEELGRLARHPYVRIREPSGEEEEEEEGADWSDETLQAILAKLAEATSVDFEHYKESTVKRRIHRRMMATRTRDLEEYLELLDQDSTEVQSLYGEMLILVTEFFRDPEVYEVLGDEVLPEIVEAHGDGSPIRIWVPGCSTGQEAYSMAIELQEVLDRTGSQLQFQVFGTDISREAVDQAREGLYPTAIEAELSESRLQRFFDRTEGGYRIKKNIRTNCIFSVHDVTADPPFSNIDLVSCRNVIIYMDPILQRRAMGMFHYSLGPDGYLVLGSSESPGQASDLFKKGIEDSSVYRPRAVTSNALQRFSGTPEGAFVHRLPTPEPQDEIRSHDRRARTDEILLDRYAPPGVVVNADLEIVEFKGSTGRFLQQPSGQATHHLLKLTRPQLRTAVGQAIDRVREENGAVVHERAHFEEDGERVTVEIEALPVQTEQGLGEHYLVLFKAEPDEPGPSAPGPSLVDAVQGRLAQLIGEEGGAKDERIEELEAELASTREYLQSLIEDYEATVEELQSTNEEALSANEELQSTNEELETAKEELQSTNEELMTLNDELQDRNEEVQRVNDDLRNLLKSVGIPIVMLGSDLQIRRFTDDARDLLNLRREDKDRPLTEVKLPIDTEELQDLMLDVLDNLQVEEREIETADGDSYHLRVQPYRTSDNKVDGVVLVFLDPEHLEPRSEDL